MSDQHEHTTDGEYRNILKQMEKDLNRSTRQRQVERAHGQNLPSLLDTLYRKHDGNASAVLRELNERIQDSSVSRPTLYNWLDEFEIRE